MRHTKYKTNQNAIVKRTLSFEEFISSYFISSYQVKPYIHSQDLKKVG